MAGDDAKARRKLCLVEDARQWHRWWSMRWIIISAILEALRQAWPSLPFEWVASFPSWVPAILGSAALLSAVAAGVSRVVKQADRR